MSNPWGYKNLPGMTSIKALLLLLVALAVVFGARVEPASAQPVGAVELFV
jgi:hypothetical protein